MESLTARLGSFDPPTSSRSRNKPARAVWQWPTDTHPRLNPQRMADAGFFFDPTDEPDDDTCKCFCCGSRLGGWDAEADDPLEEHSRKDCAWAEMFCVPRLAVEKDEVSYTVDREELLPDSTTSAQLRLKTFQDSWPHKPKKGWKPTAQAVAAAGFVYYGQKGSLDCVVCPWCNWTPADWEATDDPLVTHREKKPHCPFFNISLASQSEAPTKSKAKAARATKGKRTTTAASQADSGDIAESIIVAETESAVPVKKGRKPRGTAATGASTSTATRAPRGRGKKAAVAESVAESQIAADEPETGMTETEAVEEEKPKRRGGRAKKTDVDASQATEVGDEAEMAPVKKGRKPRATKAKQGKKAVEVQEEEPGETGSEVELPQEEQEEEAESTPKPIPAKSKSSRPSKAVPPPASTIPDEQLQEVRPATKADRTFQLPDDTSTAAPTTSTSTSSRSRPIAGKPKPKSKPASSNKALPALPPPSEPSLTPRSQPLNALTQFSNIPPTSPIPQSELSLSPSHKQAKSFRQAMVDFAISPSSPQPSSLPAVQQAGHEEEEKWLKAELSEEEKKMTLEEFMRREVAERVERMERDGKEMIRWWKEQAERARKEIEQAL